MHEALAAMEASHPEHPHIGNILDTMGLSALRQEKLEEAEDLLRRALALRETSLEQEGTPLAMTRSYLARVLARRGEHEEARQRLEQAWEIVTETPTPSRTRAELAFALAKSVARTAADRPRALELARSAVEDYREAGEPWNEERAEVERWLAQTFGD